MSSLRENCPGNDTPGSPNQVWRQSDTLHPFGIRGSKTFRYRTVGLNLPAPAHFQIFKYPVSCVRIMSCIDDGFYCPQVDYQRRRNPAYEVKERMYDVLRSKRCDMTERGIISAIQQGEVDGLVRLLQTIANVNLQNVCAIMPPKVVCAILSYTVIRGGAENSSSAAQ